MDHANAMIDDLITTLNDLYKTNNNLATVIKNPVLLIQGLTELRNMIEMNNIKLTIVEQVKLLITNKSMNYIDNSHMLHCVISGNPGVGKTSVARILAKIWISLDMIKKPTKKAEPNHVDLLEKSIIEYDYKLDKIISGLKTQKKIIDELKPNISTKKIKNLTKDLKYNVDKLLDIADLIVEQETDDIPFVVATREQFVASYLGQSAPKTKALLEKALGGVLFIDEAYSLYNSDRDSYGEECLNVINEFMSLRSGEIIIIFAGYKDLMMNTIFKVQQGLYRRCMWFFEIEDYTLPAIVHIFKNQLENKYWKLDNAISLGKVLSQYKLKNAGDTEKLVYYCKISYAEYHFDHVLDNKLHDNIITHDILIKAIEKLTRNNPVVVKNTPPCHMYT